MSETFSKVEVITGVARRRRFSTDLKLAVVAETMQPGMSISYVARRHGLSPSLSAEQFQQAKSHSNTN
jgi:transposase